MLPGVGIPFMYALGFTDPAVAVTLTRIGSGVPGITPMFFHWVRLCTEGQSLVARPTDFPQLLVLFSSHLVAE